MFLEKIRIYGLKKRINRFCAILLVGTIFLQSTLLSTNVFAENLNIQGISNNLIVSENELTISENELVISENETDIEVHKILSNNSIMRMSSQVSESLNEVSMGLNEVIEGTDEECGDFTFNPETNTIVACVNNPTNKELVIPAKINNVDVLYINDLVFSARGFTSITFEEGSKLETIGNKAFYNNPLITNVQLPQTVKSIGEYAFAECDELTTINIPAGVNTIRKGTFEECRKLKSVTLEGEITSIEDRAFYYCNKLNAFTFSSSLKTIGERAFYYTALNQISFHEGLESIGQSAFASSDYYASLIEGEVELPDSVQFVGQRAFEGQKLISIFKFGTGIKNIPLYIFASCSGLQEIHLPKLEIEYTNLSNLGNVGVRYFKDTIVQNGFLFNGSEPVVKGYIGEETDIIIPSSFTNAMGENIIITTLGDWSFYDNDKITSVTIPSTIIDTGDNTFYYCDQLNTVNLSAATSLTSLGNFVFYYCSKLNTVELPSNISSIGNSSFNLCRILHNVELPSKLQTIGDNAFDSSGLTEVSLPASLQSIGKRAFYSTGITSVVIPDSIKSIPDSCFNKCELLINVTLQEGLNSIGSNAFENTSIENLEIPSSVTSINTSSLDTSSLKTIRVNKEEDSIKFAPWGATAASIYWKDTLTIGDWVYSSKNKELKKYIGTSTTVSVPSNLEDTSGVKYSVEKIGAALFAYNEDIISVDIAEGIQEIPDNAFDSCINLNKVVLPTTITSIGKRAFASCNKLNDINAPTSIIEIGSYAFYMCDVLGEFKIPSYTKRIGDYAFYFSGLSGELILPDTLIELGEYAFASTKIISAILPTSITSLDDRIFQNCDQLQTVDMGNSIKTCGDYIFLKCKNLVDVQLPLTLQSIGYSMFYGCEKLESVDIPTSVTKFETNAFYNCKRLSNISLPEGLDEIQSSALASTAISQLQIPSTVTKVNNTALKDVECEMIFVNQTRDTVDFHADGPWGAQSTCKVYYKGEVVVLNGIVSPIDGKYLCEIKLSSDNTVTIQSITFPIGLIDEDGNAITAEKIAVGDTAFEKTVYANKNGSYTFQCVSSTGITSEFTMVVEGIGKPGITTENSYTVTPAMLENRNLTSEELIRFMNVTATDGVADLDITISDEDMEKVNALTKLNPSTNIVLSAISKYPSAEAELAEVTKTVNIVYLAKANILVKSHDGKEILNNIYDTDVEVHVFNNADDSTVTNTYTVGYDKDVQLPNPCSKLGYTFVKWTVMENKDSSIDIMPTYTINTYKVKFDTQGGTNIELKECDYNTTVEKPTVNPIRDEYVFGGWYKEAQCINEYEFLDKITGDITLYAKWNHEHKLEYSVENNVIIATCKYQNNDCEYQENNYVAGTMELEEPNSYVAEDGINKEFKLKPDSNWTEHVIQDITLRYYTQGSDSPLQTVPTTRGFYTVQILVGNEEVYTKDYEITNAIISPETVFKNYETVSSSWVNRNILFESRNDQYTFSSAENGSYKDCISFESENDGTTSYPVYVKNQQNGVVYCTEITYYLENTAPTFNVNGKPNKWTNSVVNLEIIAIDEGGSELAAKPYSFDGGKSWSTNKNQEFNENKEINICVKDAAGNIKTQIISSLMVDQAEPENVTLSVNLQGADGENDWYKSKVIHRLTIPKANDKEAPISSYYKLWREGEEKPNAGIEITENSELNSEDGKWNLVTYTVDEAGNKSDDSNVYTWQQDITMPVVSSLEYNTKVTFLDWILGKESIEITINVSDKTSQVNNVAAVLREDGQNEEKDKLLSVKDGIAKLVVNSEWKGDIAFVAIDYAGNKSQSCSITSQNKGIIIEQTKPTICMQVPKANKNGWYKDDVTIGATIQDLGISSGIKQVSYSDTNSDDKRTKVVDADSFTNSFVFQHDYEAVVTKDGIHTIVFEGYDYAGNEAEELIASQIKIDKTAPNIDVAYTDLVWTNKEQIEVEFSATDATSGVYAIKVFKGQETFEVTTNNNASSFMADENGTYIISVTDFAGNIKTTEVEVTKFDRIKPEVEWTVITDTFDSTCWYGVEQVKGKINAVEKNVATDSSLVSDTDISYVILNNDNNKSVETTIVNLVETGTYTITAVIKDGAGNENTINKKLHIETTIDEFNDMMVNVNETTGADELVTIKGAYDKFLSLVRGRLATNLESAQYVKKLLALLDANKEEILLESKIQEIERLIEEASIEDNYGMNEAVIAFYETLTEIERNKLEQSTIDNYNLIVKETLLVSDLITAVNLALKPSDISYIDLIAIAEAKYNELPEMTKKVVPSEVLTSLSTLGTYRDQAQNVNNMSLLDFEHVIKAKMEYSLLEPYAQSMVDIKSIEIAYQNLLSVMETDEKTLAIFREHLATCNNANTITMKGIELLEGSYNNLSEIAKNSLIDQEKFEYAAFCNAQNIYGDFITRCNTIVPSDSILLENIIKEYNNMFVGQQNKVLDKALVDNSITICLGDMEKALNEARTIEASIELLKSNVESNVDGMQIYRYDIVKIKEEVMKLEQVVYSLINPDMIQVINQLYNQLLEFNNQASTEKSSVEVVGLTDKVQIPKITSDIISTVVKVVMKDSIPQVVPMINEKSLMLSSDIKLLCIQTVTTGIKDKIEYSEYIQPKYNESIWVKLKLPGGYNLDTIEIVHVKDNGVRNMIQEVKVIRENEANYAIFETESFSHFLVYAEKIIVPTISENPDDEHNQDNSGNSSMDEYNQDNNGNYSFNEYSGGNDLNTSVTKEVSVAPELLEIESTQIDIVNKNNTENIEKEKKGTEDEKQDGIDTPEIIAPQVPLDESKEPTLVEVDNEDGGITLIHFMYVVFLSLLGICIWFFIIWKKKKENEQDE